MPYARAAIAGVLSSGVVLLLLTDGPIRDPERLLAALVGLLTILGLLVGVDVLPFHRKRPGDDQED